MRCPRREHLRREQKHAERCSIVLCQNWSPGSADHPEGRVRHMHTLCALPAGHRPPHIWSSSLEVSA